MYLRVRIIIIIFYRFSFCFFFFVFVTGLRRRRAHVVDTFPEESVSEMILPHVLQWGTKQTAQF